MLGKSNGFKDIRETPTRLSDLSKPIIGIRWVIVILSFLTYSIQWFVRNSFPVALVAMVTSNTTDESSDEETMDVCPAALNNSYGEDESESMGEFDWSASEQGTILGAYSWGFVASKLLFSRGVEIVGPAITVAFGNIIAGIVILFSPLMASKGGPYALAASRFMVGLCYGPVPSAFNLLFASWAKVNERASMYTTTFSGATLGGMIGLFTAGWLTDQYGWEIVFWLGGALSFVMPPIYLIMVRNSPSQHPWVSEYERKLLEETSHIKTQATVPWIKILTSPFLWICQFCLFTRAWLDIVLTTEGPSFFKFKIGLDINTASYVTGANYLSAAICIFSFGRISDFIITKKYLSLIHTRKLFHFIGTGGAILLLIGICIADCNQMPVIVMYILIGGVASATSCSYNVSVIDFAPNYAATVTGLLALGNIGGALAPSVTSFLLNKGFGWNGSFYLLAILTFISLVIYVPYMTAEVQPWNFEDEQKVTDSSSDSNHTAKVEDVKNEMISL